MKKVASVKIERFYTKKITHAFAPTKKGTIRIIICDPEGQMAVFEGAFPHKAKSIDQIGIGGKY